MAEAACSATDDSTPPSYVWTALRSVSAASRRRASAARLFLSASLSALRLRPPQVRRGRAREQGLFLPPGAGNVMRSGRALMEGLAQVGPAPVRGSSLEPVVSVELAAAGAESETLSLNSQRTRT